MRVRACRESPTKRQKKAKGHYNAIAMKTFIGPVVDRTQYTFFKEILEDSIPADHPVRVVDWSEWIAGYPGARGT